MVCKTIGPKRQQQSRDPSKSRLSIAINVNPRTLFTPLSPTSTSSVSKSKQIKLTQFFFFAPSVCWKWRKPSQIIPELLCTQNPLNLTSYLWLSSQNILPTCCETIVTKPQHIFQNAQVTSNIMVHNKRHNFWHSFPFHFNQGVPFCFECQLQKPLHMQQLLIGCQRISASQKVLTGANTRNKTDCIM